MKVFPDEINAKQQEEFVAVVVPARISGIVFPQPDSSSIENQESALDSSEIQDTIPRVIAFDSLGGSLDSGKRIVTGVVQDSSFIEVAFDDILFIKLKGTDFAERFATPRVLEVSRDEARGQPWKRIRPETSVYWDVIDFDKHKGKYDPSKEVIIGTSNRGTPVEIELDQIQYLEIKIYDPYKNLRIGIGLTSLVVFFLGTKSIFNL
ncbi:MAG: hypothetical protein GY841_22565 [FCB group bacterium]|nr:hypothetical protein [FCB group bacterium]